MPQYVDGFVIPISKKNLGKYLVIAKACATIWIEHGALEYRECVGEDLSPKGMPGFKLAKPVKAGETILFSWIVYRSRAHRDKVNAKVMKDPRLAAMCKGAAMPFDVKRMAYGGFTTLVKA
jgi:uncharacterized protein YbaA (DUF1428 family)